MSMEIDYIDIFHSCDSWRPLVNIILPPPLLLLAVHGGGDDGELGLLAGVERGAGESLWVRLGEVVGREVALPEPLLVQDVPVVGVRLRCMYKK